MYFFSRIFPVFEEDQKQLQLPDQANRRMKVLDITPNVSNYIFFKFIIVIYFKKTNDNILFQSFKMSDRCVFIVIECNPFTSR